MTEEQAFKQFLSECPETLDDEMMDKFDWWLNHNEIELAPTEE